MIEVSKPTKLEIRIFETYKSEPLLDHDKKVERTLRLVKQTQVLDTILGDETESTECDNAFGRIEEVGAEVSVSGCIISRPLTLRN